jgi:hypothetical protein
MGLVAALLLSCAVFPSTRIGPGGRFDWHCALAVLIWVGVYLGWQATCALAVLTAAMQFAVGLGRRIRRRSPRLGWNGCLAIGALVWIVGWKSIVERFPYVGQQADIWTLLAALGTTAVFSGMTWKMAGRRLNAIERPAFNP